MSTTITNLDALRAAQALTKNVGDYQSTFQLVVLEPDGRLVATDGFSLLIAYDAHDADERTMFRFQRGKNVWKSAKTAELFRDAAVLKTDKGVLEVEFDDEAKFPNYERVLPDKPESDTGNLPGTVFDLDVTRAAAIVDSAGLDGKAAVFEKVSKSMYYLNSDPIHVFIHDLRGDWKPAGELDNSFWNRAREDTHEGSDNA